MSNDEINLTLEKRDIVGKGLNKLKDEGKIPAVIHDHGKESIVVSGSLIDLSKVYQEAGKSHPVNIKVGNDDHFAIIKEVDYDPKKNKLRHIVFSTIKKGEKVKAEVPIDIGDDIPAERAGLIVIHALDHLEIEAVPKNLVDSLKADGSKLNEVGDKLHVSDIEVPEGVEILAEPDQTIVTIDEPRVVEEPEPVEGEGEEGEEGEAGAEGEEGESKDGEKSEDSKDNKGESEGDKKE